MALINNNILQSLNSYGFIGEFNMHDKDYLIIARIVAKNVINNLQKAGVQLSLNPLDDFADKHLVEKVKIWIVHDTSFLWFRQALTRGNRMYIKPCDYEVWGEMMARFVLSEAIRQRIIP